MRWKEITGQDITETCTAGATGSGNVAVSISASGSGSIGAGFDANGHKGIYDAAERKKKRKKSS